MASPFTKKRLTDVEDSAPKFGHGDVQQVRFANSDLDVAQTGLSYHRLAPGKRQAFGHSHEKVEEIYVVLSGAGRVKLDDEIVEVEVLDAVRSAPGSPARSRRGRTGSSTSRQESADEDDFEILQGWWDD